MIGILEQVFGGKSSRLARKQKTARQSRTLRLEPLEHRQLLTVVSLVASHDTSIFSGFTSNSAGQGGLYVGLNNDLNNIKRAMLEFDISSVVPAGATINSVSLSMYAYRNRNGGTETVELHKMTADWGEGTASAGQGSGAGQGAAASANDATWLKPFFGQVATWAKPGGDFSAAVSGSTVVAGPSGTGSYTWASTTQMVADVQSWLNNPGANYGWMLKGAAANETTNTSHAFYSREWTNVAQRPTLTIDYTPASSHLPPTLDAIANPAAINENAGAQTVSLTGITAGAGQNEALSVTAASDNTALIPNPSVTYTSPNSTGSISYTPAANKSGTAKVTVTVRNAGLDGTLGTGDDGTFARTFTVTVNDVNQAPTLDAIANPAAVNENAAAQTVNLAGITAGAGDTQTLQVTAASDNTALIPNPTVAYTSPSATGSISYTPVANKFGTANVTVTVRDAGLDGTLGNADDASFSRTFTVAVNDVNQAPTLDAIANPAAIAKDSGVQTVNLSGITAGAGDSQTLQVTAASDNTALIPNPTVAYTSPNATGSISYTPVANASGTAKVTVTVRDAGRDGTLGNADDATFSRTFTVTVDNANLSPTLDAIANPAAIGENSGLQTVNLTGISAGTGENQALQITATSDNTALIPNPTVRYTSPNATGSISYTPAANKFGTANVTVTVRDAGLDGTLGNADDGVTSRTFTVTVNDVNQPPTLGAIADPAAIAENAGLQTVSLAGIGAGAGESQALQITASSDNTALIPTPAVDYTSPNATGSISYQPVAGQSGTAHVTVTARDAGLDGTLGNADDGVTSRTFTVKVNSANSLPTGVRLQGGVLEIVGTDGDDRVTVRKSNYSTMVVAASFLSNARGASFRAADVRRIVIRLGDGNDTGTIDRSIRVPAIVDGGAGNDVLRGGAAPVVLLGGDGNDDLATGTGRGVLIGGAGADKLKGYVGSDLLISGKTAYDADDAALLAILSEWTSRRTFATRVKNLAAGVGANHQYRLKAVDTVFDDQSSDSLSGGSSNDWFFAFSGDKVVDRGRLDL